MHVNYRQLKSISKFLGSSRRTGTIQTWERHSFPFIIHTFQVLFRCIWVNNLTSTWRLISLGSFFALNLFVFTAIGNPICTKEHLPVGGYWNSKWEMEQHVCLCPVPSLSRIYSICLVSSLTAPRVIWQHFDSIFLSFESFTFSHGMTVSLSLCLSTEVQVSLYWVLGTYPAWRYCLQSLTHPVIHSFIRLRYFAYQGI